MSSNLVAWVTAFEYRHTGASLQTLSAEVDVLREELRRRGRDVGFTGSAEEAVKHAVSANTSCNTFLLVVDCL